MVTVQAGRTVVLAVSRVWVGGVMMRAGSVMRADQMVVPAGSGAMQASHAVVWASRAVVVM